MATTITAPKPLLADLASTTNYVPSNFIRPLNDRPNLEQSSDVHDSIPIIDLQGLDGSNRHEIINNNAQACENYGFFQVVNHGVPEGVVGNMVNVSKEIFDLPESERLKSYSDDPSKTTRLSTSFNVKTEKVANWRDYLRLHCHPLEDYIKEWPINRPSFREDVAEYSKYMRKLSLRLLEAISESLGLGTDYMDKALGKHGQHMVQACGAKGDVLEVNGLSPKEIEKGKFVSEEKAENNLDLERKKREECVEEEFLKIMKSEYDILEQSKKTPATISLLSLIMSFEPHQKAFLKVLKETYVKSDVTLENMVNMVDPVKHLNMITFSNEEIVSWSDPRALYITLKCKGYIVTRVLIDGGSGLNVLPRSTLNQLSMSIDDLTPQKIATKAYDGTVRNTLGEVVLLLEIGEYFRSVVPSNGCQIRL